MRARTPAFLIAAAVCTAVTPARAGWRDVLPKDWTVESSAEGDLNGDGRPDVAATLSHAGADGARKDVRVVVLMKKKDGGYALHTDSPNAACAGCGALAGTDGVEGLVSIRKGALVLSYRAGARGAWKVTTRWRLRSGRFVLDGFTRQNQGETRPGDLISAEANAGTGRLKERVAASGGRFVARACRVPARFRESTLTGFDFANAEPWPSCGPESK
jgi:hypothetical protein